MSYKVHMCDIYGRMIIVVWLQDKKDIELSTCYLTQ